MFLWEAFRERRAGFAGAGASVLWLRDFNSSSGASTGEWLCSSMALGVMVEAACSASGCAPFTSPSSRLVLAILPSACWSSSIGHSILCALSLSLSLSDGLEDEENGMARVRSRCGEEGVLRSRATAQMKTT
jgi:hypothetical protein